MDTPDESKPVTASEVTAAREQLQRADEIGEEMRAAARRADVAVATFMENAEPRTRRGKNTSEYRVAVALPALGALGATALAALDKVPVWAQTPEVLIAAIAGTSFLAGCYVLSRGMAKR